MLATLPIGPTRLGPSIAISALPSVFVVVHNQRDPTDGEWTDFVRLSTMPERANRPTLVYSAGGRPTALQRKQLADAIPKRRVPPTVVLTENRLVQTVVRLMTWFNPDIRAFPIEDLDGALKYMGVAAHEAPLIREEIRALRLLVDT